MTEYVNSCDQDFKLRLEAKIRELAPNSHLASRIVIEVEIKDMGFWGGELIRAGQTLELELYGNSKLPWRLHLTGELDLDSLKVLSID